MRRTPTFLETANAVLAVSRGDGGTKTSGSKTDSQVCESELSIHTKEMKSVITYGGDAPNVVPPYAQIWYYVRAPHREQVEEIYSRMLDIAKGAALMSGTTHDIDFLTGCYELLPNGVISNLMIEKMEELGGPRFTDEEMAFAKQLQEAIPPQVLEMGIMQTLQMSGNGVTREDLGETLCEKIIPLPDTFTMLPASTEVGDVSQITPTGNLSTCCQPLGTPPHSWQAVAASGSSPLC